MKKTCDFLKSFSWLKIFLIFAALAAIVRTIFLVQEAKEIQFTLPLILQVYGVGLFFDFITLCYISLIPLLYYVLVTQKFFNSKAGQNFLKVSYFIFIFVITFSAFAEWFFFDEFQTRFNFIAVDYLIYTGEVIGNIMESYPMGKLMCAILLISSAIFFFTNKKIVRVVDENFAARAKRFLVILAITAIAFVTIDSSKLSKISNNNYVKEITQNGIYQLFSAYRNNQIDYDQLYITADEKEVTKLLRAAILKQEPKSKFLNEDDISRQISAPNSGGEKKYNVMLVSIESLSAEFLASFGNEENITPNLDKFAKGGLLFTNLKATGTRTVRGLEALTLSIPPTPGNSIVRRPNNENLFNLSSPLKDRGYDAKFVYGGFGYFDNMNYFYENNGFEIVDRDKFAKEEISFANVWGVADEDLFDKAIKEADKSYAAGKPFINFIMTTSNHRPFTYPSGKIDIEPKTGRNGAVKYTDYAIGQFVEKARKKVWFDNTIFLFVADHCAGSAGNTDVPLWRYQIPAVFYAPKIIKPQIFDKNVSQIDIAPTILGMLNLSYKSKFFGTDVLNNNKNLDQHSFVSTYTDIGYFKDNKLYLLKPKKEKKVFDVTIKKYGWNASKEEQTKNYSEEELLNAIAYYQGASALFKNDKLKNFTKN
jgi:phosphoglycerol transferase MdoB-like AlkP superfamily enzyme